MSSIVLRKPRNNLQPNKREKKYQDEQAISEQLRLENEKEELGKDTNDLHSRVSLSSMESVQDSLNEITSLNDLIEKALNRLQEIEHEYKIDDLFNYLRYYLNYSNYAGLTLKSLDSFYKSQSFMQNVNNRFSILMKDKSIGIIPYLPANISDAVPKLFKLLKNLQINYSKIQKDILINVLIRDKVDVDSLKRLRTPLVSQKYEIFSPESIRQRRDFLNNSRLNRLHEIIYDLNEKIIILLHDYTHSDLRLFSHETKLPQKYEFFKHGEYLVRLIPDILFKSRLVLKISQKCFEMTSKNYSPQSNDLIRLPPITSRNQVRFEAVKNPLIKSLSDDKHTHKQHNEQHLKLIRQPKATPILLRKNM